MIHLVLCRHGLKVEYLNSFRPGTSDFIDVLETVEANCNQRLQGLLTYCAGILVFPKVFSHFINNCAIVR